MAWLEPSCGAWQRRRFWHVAARCRACLFPAIAVAVAVWALAPRAEATPGTATPRTTQPPRTTAITTPGTTPGNNNGTQTFRDRTLPHEDYFRTITGLLDDGQYREAEKAFKATWRNAMRDVDGRWVDSICHYTMIGESQYRLGNTAEALENFDQALNLFVRWRNYMLRVQFTDLALSNQATHLRPCPWGASRRGAKPGHATEKMQVAQGQIDNSEVVRKGGVVRVAMYRIVVTQEVVRATAWAMYRRREILGPVCKHEPLTPQLVSAFREALTPARHWSEAWVTLQQGMAYTNSEQPNQALEALGKSLLLAGQYDHPLACVSLLTMGRLYLEAGKLQEAADAFLEASYSAFRYPEANMTVLEEALRYGQMTYLLSGQRGVYPPLPKAYEWAKVKRMRELEVSLAISMAECYAVSGQAPLARQWLEEARVRMGVRDMVDSRLGARFDLINAQVNFMQNNRRPADEALGEALKFQRLASNRLLQIRGTDKLVRAGAISPRLAMFLYPKVLGEMTTTDWSVDPLESLAVTATPHGESFDQWFEVAISEKHHEEAVEIAELARRHRFFSSLPLGGRAVALRWMLEGPDDVVSESMRVRRQDILARYPKYAELSKKSAQLRDTLKKEPLIPADQTAQQKQTELLKQLMTTSQQQEIILHEMAVRREPSEFLFPPIRRTQTVTRSLPKGHALWVFYATRNGLYSFMLANGQYDYWRVAETDKLKREIGNYLRLIGNYGQNNEITTTQLKDESWRKSARTIVELLLRGSRVDLATLQDELIVVPDGPLWYLPFESLPAGLNQGAPPLIAETRVRYLPFSSLVAPYRKTPAVFGAGTVVVRAGKMMPRDDAAVAGEAAADLKRALPSVAAFDAYLNSASPIVSSLFDDLVVFDEITPSAKGPSDWSPTQLDRSNGLGDMTNWFALPFGGPNHVMLPGFRTAAESGLKGKTPGGGDGQDLFLATAGMMANGARSVMISRWRVGGKTSFDLAREFAQELPRQSAAGAWQRSVQMAMETPLDPSREPRLRITGDEANFTAGHPFFWAGYLVADQGAPAKTVDLVIEPADPRPPGVGDAAAAPPPVPGS